MYMHIVISISRICRYTLSCRKRYNIQTLLEFKARFRKHFLCNLGMTKCIMIIHFLHTYLLNDLKKSYMIICTWWFTKYILSIIFSHLKWIYFLFFNRLKQFLQTLLYYLQDYPCLYNTELNISKVASTNFDSTHPIYQKSYPPNSLKLKRGVFIWKTDVYISTVHLIINTRNLENLKVFKYISKIRKIRFLITVLLMKDGGWACLVNHPV